MWFRETVCIADNERAFLFRNKRLDAVLTPGTHKIGRLKSSDRLETFETSNALFEHPQARSLVKHYPDILDDYLKLHELGEYEVGLLYVAGSLHDIVQPGNSVALWRGSENVRLDVKNLKDNIQIEESVLGILKNLRQTSASLLEEFGIFYCEVPVDLEGQLSVNGRYEKTLTPGAYGFWCQRSVIDVKLVDKKLQYLGVFDEDVQLHSGESQQWSVNASYKICHSRKVLELVKDAGLLVYRELQIVIREVAANIELQELHKRRAAINAVLQNKLQRRLKNFGLEPVSVGLIHVRYGAVDRANA